MAAKWSRSSVRARIRPAPTCCRKAVSNTLPGSGRNRNGSVARNSASLARKRSRRAFPYRPASQAAVTWTWVSSSASEETMTRSSLATWSRTASLSGSCQRSLSSALLSMQTTRSADLAGLAVGDEELLHPPDGSPPTHLGLPPGMPSGIEALAGRLDLSDAHELGDRLPIACDGDLLLALQHRLGSRPALAQVPHGDGLHGARLTCFTPLGPTGQIGAPSLGTRSVTRIPAVRALCVATLRARTPATTPPPG